MLEGFRRQPGGAGECLGFVQPAAGDAVRGGACGPCLQRCQMAGRGDVQRADRAPADVFAEFVFEFGHRAEGLAGQRDLAGIVAHHGHQRRCPAGRAGRRLQAFEDEDALAQPVAGEFVGDGGAEDAAANDQDVAVDRWICHVFSR